MEQEYSIEERNWAMACHLAAFGWLVIPYVGQFIGPLIIWLIKRERHPLVDDQGKEALNFQITLVILDVILLFLGVGGFIAGLVVAGSSGRNEPPAFGFIAFFGMFVLMGLLMLMDLILIIVAAVRAAGGQRYRYPFAIRLIR